MGKPNNKNSSRSEQSSANIGFEAKLWLAADKFRKQIDANIEQSQTLATLRDAAAQTAVRRIKGFFGNTRL